MLRRWGLIAGMAAIAAVVLALRFSPDWLRFLDEAREAESVATNDLQRRAIDRALVSGAAERGATVLDQKRDLGAIIEDPNHKALRWRLLPPAVGRALGLSDWATLGLAQLGCVALVLMLVFIGTPRGGSLTGGGLWLALTAGATAPVITSLGWLGYYDSLLALGLLTVAFIRPRGAVIAACLLAPWVDERFVLGFPLALLVRWQQTAHEAPRTWLRREAAVPAILTAAFAITRLTLGGTGGSQTIGDYVTTFILGQDVTLSDRLFGAWSGLRVGWLVLAAGFAAAGSRTSPKGESRPTLLAGLTLATAAVGAGSVQDTARAMVLILPVIIWAWLTAAQRWERLWLGAGPLLALAAIMLPAHQVFGRIRTAVPPPAEQPADHPLVRAQNNLGYLHDRGEAGPRNVAEARKWYTRAATAGLAEAQFNLAMLILRSETAAQEAKTAERWLLAAARQGLTPAQRTLSALYLGNHGFEKNLPLAWAWLSLADAATASASDLFERLALAEQTEALRLKASLLYSGASASGK